MAALDVLGAALLVVCLWLVVLVARRRVFARDGGVVEMSLHERHWRHGAARYDGDRLLWFRTFSFSMRPSRVFERGQLRVCSRREPHGAEALTLVHDAVVLECSLGDDAVELAVPPAALLGLLAWLEAAPTYRLVS